MFCDVDAQAVITARDVASVYEVPLEFAEQRVDEILLHLLKVEGTTRNLSRRAALLSAASNRVRRPCGHK